ncbi:hypothetical protein LIER_31410 [Lithospermum erythrorhizon]|uniref:Uncharacterized protein n=1 Tax=Lithospermum erythrorhizon TaxID=34254 RepID=A0AAV3RUW7_LITER
MAEINGDEFSDNDVHVVEFDSKASDFNQRIAALEQENRQLVHEKDVIEKRIADLKREIEEANNDKDKLLYDLEQSKEDIKNLGSVAARAAQLEGDVSRLQHELISTTSALEEVSSELADVKLALDVFKKKETDKDKELEAVVVERDLLIEKLGDLEAKENRYLNEMNDKEKEIGTLRVKVEEFKVLIEKSVDEKKDIEKLTSELEVRVGELERKLEDKERVIDGFEKKERETIVVQGKTGGLMTREMNMGLPVIVGSVVCAVGLGGLVCYLHQVKRT